MLVLAAFVTLRIWDNLRPGLAEKARTPLELSFAARALAKRMFAVLDWE